MSFSISGKVSIASSGLHKSVARPVARKQAVVSAQKSEDLSRRVALSMAAAAAILSKVGPSEAKYGEPANVFGKITSKSGYVPYAGEGYSVLLPSRWNPSKEREFPNIDLRYEDNFDVLNNVMVIKEKTDKSSVSDFGAATDFLNKYAYVLGKQSYSGETKSEGGFAPNKASVASVFDSSEGKDKKGRTVYKYEVLVRTADGNEGGRHQLISATVSNGVLYILKIQAGDKRWIRGTKREAFETFNSFTIA